MPSLVHNGTLSNVQPITMYEIEKSEQTQLGLIVTNQNYP